MAFDIQVVRLLDVLDVNTIEEAPGVTPRSIIVSGKDFGNVEQVLLNGTPSPEFVVFQPNKLIAQVPDIAVEQVIRDVTILSGALTLTERSIVEFTMGTTPKKTSGILRLMQTFIRLLLRTPGTNVYNRSLGGGLLGKVGTVLAAGNRNRASADASVAVTRTRQQIINTQTPDRSIPPSERLMGADLTALTVDAENGQLLLTVLLTNHSGDAGAATLIT